FRAPGAGLERAWRRRDAQPCCYPGIFGPTCASRLDRADQQSGFPSATAARDRARRRSSKLRDCWNHFLFPERPKTAPIADCEIAGPGLEIGEASLGPLPVFGLERAVDASAGFLDQDVKGAGLRHIVV